MGDGDTIGPIFSALADPTRRAILAQLAGGEATVNELAEPLEMTLPNVSKHVKVLLDAGLILQRKDAQRRPCRLNPEGLKQVEAWSRRYIDEWEESFQRLDALLAEISVQAEGN
ncbi:ArsR/SmtB family transcription factor [Caulobacter mirabilis]|uniref:Transcriptional regulator n=1 Tax=Caulobacter mirabilis TaxID=69666 RepID=A0A2D2B0C7_9CAUL|nr:metalloregulator ArsR/SmtB family transcription factor [Caulobacter mirabilis]ATQ43693.1 transcriptional regulator [Caulobacter mirabilis]